MIRGQMPQFDSMPGAFRPSLASPQREVVLKRSAYYDDVAACLMVAGYNSLRITAQQESAKARTSR